MAARLTVIVEPATLRSDSQGSITGGLSVAIEDLVFPEASWSDYPVIVLAWWARECPNVVDRELATFAFMDGSLAFWVRPRTEGDAVVEFTREGDAAGSVFASATVEPRSVVEAVLNAGRGVLAACREKSWTNPDLDELAAAIEEAGRPST